MRREDRFIGHGNFACGDGHSRRKAWKIHCATCPQMKMLTMPGSALPPDAVLKRFIQAGWNIGKNEDEDQCPACVNRRRDHKERQEREKINAPVSYEETYYGDVQRERSFICNVYTLLRDARIDDAIALIEKHLPETLHLRRPVTPKVEAPKKVEPTDDFDKWLAEQERSHRERLEKSKAETQDK